MQLPAPCHQNTSGREWGRVEDVPVPQASVQSGAAPQLAPRPHLDPRSFQPSRPCPVPRAAPAPALPTPPAGSSCSSSTPQPPAQKPPEPTQPRPSRRDATAGGLGAGTARTHPALGSVPLKSKGGGKHGQQRKRPKRILRPLGIPRRTFPSSSYTPPWARAQPRSRPTRVPAEHLPPLHPCAAHLPFFRKR